MSFVHVESRVESLRVEGGGGGGWEEGVVGGRGMGGRVVGWGGLCLELPIEGSEEAGVEVQQKDSIKPQMARA